jgi:SAM-dependent methyltransferase
MIALSCLARMVALRDSRAMHKADLETISDFGDQWLRYTLADIIEPLVPLSEIAGKNVAEIGAGTGRIVSMLCAAGAAHIMAIEPSDAFAVLLNNTAKYGSCVTCIQSIGEQIPPRNFDIVLSIGVIHHIVDPLPTMQAARKALKPKGKIVIWVYGREGNLPYLSLFLPLRAIVRSMPHSVISVLAAALDWPLRTYIGLCRWLALPMRDYMLSVLLPLDADKRRLVIYDQLRPFYSKYYREIEVRDLLDRAGFVNLQLFHRHGYSWTAVGERH